MMNLIKRIILLVLISFIFSSTQISGSVKNIKSEPVLYANVYLENTFDGDDTDKNGNFIFITNEEGMQKLIVTFIGYEQYNQEIILNSSSLNLDIVLIAKENQSNEVVITAGAFEASDENRVVILNPIDIVTTAGSRGDITGALQALPGSQPQAEQEGLFVRGGDAAESKTIVDGLLIQNPYFSSVPDIPQRGRFTPFEFEGTVFSTGGYSAQYGQALSSIVDLTTWNRFGEVNANTFGVTPLSISYGRPFGTDDITCGINLNYTNLKSFYEFNNSSRINNFIKNTVSFIDPPEGYQVNTNFKRKYDNGVYKFYARFSANDLALDIDDGSIFNLENDNLYISSIFNGIIKNDWSMNLGASYSENNDERYIQIQEDDMNFYVPSSDNLLQFRSAFSKSLFSNSLLRWGLHLFDQHNNYIQYHYNQDNEFPYDEEEKNIDEFLSVGFTEFDIKLSRNIAARMGFRFEHSQLLDESNFAPRFSFAYKLGAYDQLAYAYGKFYQTPDLGFDQWYRQVAPTYDSKNLNLDFEQASHHILNYQWVKRNQVFRVEFYDKDYTNLITIDDDLILNNLGYGYAKGIDIFWRDNKHTFEDIDFWLSYSYLDTKRKYREYPDLLTPSFAAEHVLSLIYKQMFEIEESQFQFSMGYTFASGRPYYNKFNNFEKGMTDDYQAFNIGGSIIPPIGEGNFLVIFFNLENPFGYKNTYGYRFADYNNLELDQPQEIHPSSLRSFFIGCFMFLDNSKK